MINWYDIWQEGRNNAEGTPIRSIDYFQQKLYKLLFNQKYYQLNFLI